MIQEPTCGVVQIRPVALHQTTEVRKILIRRSEFDVWIAAYRRVGDTDVDQIVDDALAKLD